jgi:hypothetical protein
MNMKQRGRLSTCQQVLFWVFLCGMASGLCCKGQKGAGATARNSPPEIGSVTIYPEKADCESQLSLAIQSKDLDGDPITYRCEWLKNDEEISGEDKNVLGKARFKKGDIIRAKVSPSDGKAEGQAVLSPPVRILNSAPMIREIWVEPKVARATDVLTARVNATDADRDFIYFEFTWEKNGGVLADERSDHLKAGTYRKGDLVAVSATPDDRDVHGAPKKSDPIRILNSPPVIVSSPPNIVRGGVYVYSVKAVDPDDDPLFFALKNGPKGMELDGKTGTLKWQISKEEKGAHLVEIEVSDDEGAKSFQKYTVTVEVK